MHNGPVLSILVEKLAFFGYHGVSESEKQVGQHYLVDLKVEAISQATKTDDVTDTTDYGALCKLILVVNNDYKFNTLERFGQVVVDRILAEFPLVQEIELTIRKMLPPIEATVDSTGVQIRAKRQQSK